MDRYIQRTFIPRTACQAQKNNNEKCLWQWLQTFLPPSIWPEGLKSEIQRAFWVWCFRQETQWSALIPLIWVLVENGVLCARVFPLKLFCPSQMNASIVTYSSVASGASVDTKVCVMIRLIRCRIAIGGCKWTLHPEQNSSLLGNNTTANEITSRPKLETL